MESLRSACRELEEYNNPFVMSDWKQTLLSFDFGSITLGIISLATLQSLLGVAVGCTTVLYNLIRMYDHYRSKKKNKTDNPNN